MAMMDLFTMAGQIVTNADDANKDIDNVTNKAEESESRMVKAFKRIGAAVVAAFAVDKIIGFGKTMVETSAKLQALDSQFDQTFKDNQGQAMELINKQVQDQGIHVDRLRGAWSSFYGTFKGNGADANQSLDLTSKYMTLAGDASAYYDTSLEDVVSRLKSITMGNFEAGDAIGININATKMDIKAKEEYGKAWQNLSDTEKEYLLIDTVGKIYEASGAMGQGAREADGYENVMGNLKASWDRFLQVIGSPILAGVIIVIQNLTLATENMTTWFSNASISVGNLISWFQEHNTVSTILITTLGILTAGILAYNAATISATIASGAETAAIIALYAAEWVATTATTAFGAALAFITSPIGIVTLALGLLVAGGIALYNNWDFVRGKAIEIWGFISGFVSEKLNAMGIDTTSFSSVVNGVFSNLFGIMTRPFSDAYNFIMGVADRIKNSINNIFNVNIKLPHFKLDGEFSLMPPRVPKLGVEWYANGGILTKPTAFGINPSTGNIMAGGEDSTGGEAIIPLNRLPDIIAEALLKAGIGGNNQPIYLVMDGKIFAATIAPYTDQVNGTNIKLVERGLAT